MMTLLQIVQNIKNRQNKLSSLSNLISRPKWGNSDFFGSVCVRFNRQALTGKRHGQSTQFYGIFPSRNSEQKSAEWGADGGNAEGSYTAEYAAAAEMRPGDLSNWKQLGKANWKANI